jgi:hypothetical protein
MDGKLKIRFPNELWWDEIPYTTAITWLSIEPTFINETNCFVDIIDSSGNKTHVELYRPDYEKILSEKAFRIKFNLKKYWF